jgi:hypothetical protein
MRRAREPIARRGVPAAARAAQSGGREKIPTGRIVAGTQVNTGWTWHLEAVTFAEVTIELREAEVAGRYQSLMDNSTRDGHL